jgi:hypothetical protein
MLMQRVEAVHHGNVDILAFARHDFMVQRGQHGRTRVHGGRRVADGHRRHDGRPAPADPAARRLGNDVIPRLMAERAPVAEAGNGAVDDVRLELSDRVVVQLQTLHDARGEIFENDVAFFDQVANDLKSARMFDIETDALFSPVDIDVVRALRDAVVRDPQILQSFVGPVSVTLHLDHVGAHVGQRFGRMGPRQNPRKIKHGYISERSRFYFLSHTSSPMPSERVVAPDGPPEWRGRSIFPYPSDAA